MTLHPRQTSQITSDNWLTIQQRVTSGNVFDDTAPSESLAGPIDLVFENGIWKYPEQDQGGRFAIPNMKRPMSLMCLSFNLGSSLAWTLNLKGNPSNTSGTPYASGDAALYAEGDILIDGATSQQDSINYSLHVAAKAPIIHPGQYLWFGSPALAAAGIVRMTFKPLFDTKG